LNPRSTASDIPLAQLKISADQLAGLQRMYDPNAGASAGALPVDHIFKLDADDQLYAAAIMAQHGLDLKAREHLTNRWSQQWARSGGGKKTSKDERHSSVPFTGCLAHAEITYVIGSQKILRIRGYFDHNQGCKDVVFSRIPPIPVHPSVFAVALAQIRDGATFTDVKKNRKLFAAKNYQDFPTDLRTSPYRWLIETRDSRSLYRQYNRLNGVKVTEKPQVNIDEWLDPTSPQYNATLADVIFHYSAWANKAEHFEACVATEEMRQTAWKYGHESQIILDGTFGICDSCYIHLLLFIVMVIDENKKGIPVAFLLFSAPTRNKQSSSGYDTAILAKLLQTWKDTLTRCGHQYGFPRTIFNPFTAITDTDLKERGALLVVIPTIWLLICRF
ncbi:hypothetical protein DFH07DRAFT_683022, partial [Mycena maculata]